MRARVHGDLCFGAVLPLRGLISALAGSRTGGGVKGDALGRVIRKPPHADVPLNRPGVHGRGVIYTFHHNLSDLCAPRRNGEGAEVRAAAALPRAVLRLHLPVLYFRAGREGAG